jgi:hypothetical protein
LLAKGDAREAAQSFIQRMTDPAARKTWEAALLDAYPYR